jgi:hypothetical protein
MSNGQKHAYNPKLYIEKNVVKNFLPLVMALLPSSFAQLS